jgi:hypothetical protein
MNIKQVQSAVQKSGLTWVKKGSHYQVQGGLAIVNIYFRKDGRVRLHVQGSGSSTFATTSAQVIVAATSVVTGGKVKRRKNYRRVKETKWIHQMNLNGKVCCHWCDVQFMHKGESTADHVIPLSKGGSNGS